MNAVIHKKREATVASDQTIEAHLGYMRTGLDEVRKDVRELRAGNSLLREKIDQAREALDTKIDRFRAVLETKIDQVREALESKIDQVDAKIGQVRESLETKIDQVRESLDAKINQVDERLGAKIDRNQAETNLGFAKLCQEMANMRADIAGLRGMQKAMLWIMGGTGSVVGLATLGRMFHWL